MSSPKTPASKSSSPKKVAPGAPLRGKRSPREAKGTTNPRALDFSTDGDGDGEGGKDEKDSTIFADLGLPSTFQRVQESMGFVSAFHQGKTVALLLVSQGDVTELKGPHAGLGLYVRALLRELPKRGSHLGRVRVTWLDRWTGKEWIPKDGGTPPGDHVNLKTKLLGWHLYDAVDPVFSANTDARIEAAAIKLAFVPSASGPYQSAHYPGGRYSMRTDDAINRRRFIPSAKYNTKSWFQNLVNAAERRFAASVPKAATDADVSEEDDAEMEEPKAHIKYKLEKGVLPDDRALISICDGCGGVDQFPHTDDGGSCPRPGCGSKEWTGAVAATFSVSKSLLEFFEDAETNYHVEAKPANGPVIVYQCTECREVISTPRSESKICIVCGHDTVEIREAAIVESVPQDFVNARRRQQRRTERGPYGHLQVGDCVALKSHPPPCYPFGIVTRVGDGNRTLGVVALRTDSDDGASTRCHFQAHQSAEIIKLTTSSEWKGKVRAHSGDCSSRRLCGCDHDAPTWNSCIFGSHLACARFAVCGCYISGTAAEVPAVPASPRASKTAWPPMSARVHRVSPPSPPSSPSYTPGSPEASVEEPPSFGGLASDDDKHDSPAKECNGYVQQEPHAKHAGCPGFPSSLPVSPPKTTSPKKHLSLADRLERDALIDKSRAAAEGPIVADEARRARLHKTPKPPVIDLTADTTEKKQKANKNKRKGGSGELTQDPIEEFQSATKKARADVPLAQTSPDGEELNFSLRFRRVYGSGLLGPDTTVTLPRKCSLEHAIKNAVLEVQAGSVDGGYVFLSNLFHTRKVSEFMWQCFLASRAWATNKFYLIRESDIQAHKAHEPKNSQELDADELLKQLA